MAWFYVQLSSNSLCEPYGDTVPLWAWTVQWEPWGCYRVYRALACGHGLRDLLMGRASRKGEDRGASDWA